MLDIASANAGIYTKDNATKIFGSAPEYANSKIIFYRYADRITYLTDSLFILEFDNEGNFKTEVFVEDITYVFAEYEMYHAYFYLEPGESYELVMPPIEYKTEEHIFNPFFQPEKIHIGIKDMKKTDLNYLINEFDFFYDRYFDMHFLDLITLGMESNVDTFINNSRQHFSFADNEYFSAYSRYRYAALRHIATQKQYPHVVVYANYTKDTVRYDNPAYMDLFNDIYYKYFDRYLGTQGGQHLFNFINFGHSISNIRHLLSRHLELENQQLRELVILKGLNDAFMDNNFAWLPLLLTLDSLHISTNYPIHQDIAQNIADNILSMAPGTVAPPFELEDTSGNIVSLSDYRGYFVYLVFANTQTFTSQSELDLLHRIYDRYNHICKIVTILTDDDREAAKRFIRRNNYNWDFVFTEINSPIVSTYRVKAYPSYYFIDPYGTLIMSPAPSPVDNFERFLFNVVQERNGFRH